MKDDLSAGAAHIGTLLIDRLGDWVSQGALSELSGETAYSVRWYVFQLREAGYVVEAVKTAFPTLFRNGKRGYRLVDIQDEPYRPTPKPVAVASSTVVVGSKVNHPEFGVGRVVFAKEGFPKIVVKFSGRKLTERVERTVVALKD